MTATSPASDPRPTGTAFDPRPLTEPVDRRAVRAFWRQVRAQHPRSASQLVSTVIVLAVVAFFFATFVGIFDSIVSVIGRGIARDGFSPLLILVPVVIVAILGVSAMRALIGLRRARERRYRISRFAAANGMAYEDRVPDPDLPGLIFHRGSDRVSTALVRGFEPRFVEFANYAYTTGSGKNKTTHHWGYVAVKLDVPLPNIVLDAKGNNGLGSNLPTGFRREQRLSLEGDFDRHFTLYCPEGYGADALYLFTPDIMARFVDHAAQLDVEIVDDWLFLYMQRPASTVDPDTWAWLFGTVGALLTKFDQWARWRDDRLRQTLSEPGPVSAPEPLSAPGSLSLSKGPPPGVAPEGRRLKRTSGAAVVGILFLAFMIFQQFVLPLLRG